MLWQLAATEIRQRPGRAGLTLLSIIIGVAAVVAVQLTTSTTHRAYEEMYRRLNGRASLEVVHEGGTRFQRLSSKGSRIIPGVKAAVPSLQAYAVLLHRSRHIQLRLLGIDPVLDAKVRDYELTEGSSFRTDRGALLEAGVRSGGRDRSVRRIEIADTTTVGRVERACRGPAGARGVAGFNQGSAIFLSLELAQRLFAKPGDVDTISVVLEEDADEAAVREAIARSLPAGLTIRPTATRSPLGSGSLPQCRAWLGVRMRLDGRAGDFYRSEHVPDEPQ